MKPLYHVYAINRDGYRVTPKESEADRSKAETLVQSRNHLSAPESPRWVWVAVDRASGRLLTPSYA